MTTITSASHSATTSEPRPIIPPLAGFDSHARDISWLVVRLTAGGMLLVHGIMKVMPMAEKGFTATIEAFAAGSMARRGIEPALAARLCGVLSRDRRRGHASCCGLFTRFIAAALAVEFAIITFVAHWPQGFTWSREGDGNTRGPGAHHVRDRAAAAAGLRSTASSVGAVPRVGHPEHQWSFFPTGGPVPLGYSAARTFSACAACFSGATNHPRRGPE